MYSSFYASVGKLSIAMLCIIQTNGRRTLTCASVWGSERSQSLSATLESKLWMLSIQSYPPSIFPTRMTWENIFLLDINILAAERRCVSNEMMLEFVFKEHILSFSLMI